MRHEYSIDIGHTDPPNLSFFPSTHENMRISLFSLFGFCFLRQSPVDLQQAQLASVYSPSHLQKHQIPGFYEIKICFLPMLRYFLFRKSRESSSNHKEIPDLLLLRNNLFRENEHNLECIYHATCSSSEQAIWICCRFNIFWDMCGLKSQRGGEYAEKFALKDWASARILCLKLFIKTIRG